VFTSERWLLYLPVPKHLIFVNPLFPIVYFEQIDYFINQITKPIWLTHSPQCSLFEHWLLCLPIPKHIILLTLFTPLFSLRQLVTLFITLQV
jgi:hypothetical protein